MEMQNMFNEATVPVETADDSAKKERVAAMKQALKETVSNDSQFATKLRRLSGSLKVINTLGAGKNGNIIVDKNAKSEGRTLKSVSQIVGYKVQNIGDEAIEYTTEVFAQDATGKWVGTVVTKNFMPGETICLTRQYMTMLCARPEISFTLANGKIVSSSKKNAKSLKEELSAYYFSFTKEEDGTQIQVNDDEVKLAVDNADGSVKAEYVETFGYINNPKEGRQAKAKGPKYTTQDLAANFINKMLQEKGM
jgi:hypothetical protein